MTAQLKRREKEAGWGEREGDKEKKRRRGEGVMNVRESKMM